MMEQALTHSDNEDLLAELLAGRLPDARDNVQPLMADTQGGRKQPFLFQ